MICDSAIVIKLVKTSSTNCKKKVVKYIILNVYDFICSI